MDRQVYRGYCTHNSFGDYRMPVPAQNIMYRDYARKKNLNLKLSVNELFFPNCFLQLFGLLEQLDKITGVMMCSLFMLPTDRAKRKFILDKFIFSQTELHFVLESIIVVDKGDIASLEEILLINEHLAKTPSVSIINSL